MQKYLTLKIIHILNYIMASHIFSLLCRNIIIVSHKTASSHSWLIFGEITTSFQVIKRVAQLSLITVFPGCHWNLSDLKWELYMPVILFWSFVLPRVLVLGKISGLCEQWWWQGCSVKLHWCCTAGGSPEQTEGSQTVPIHNNQHSPAFCCCLSLTSSFHVPLSMYTQWLFRLFW